MRYLFRFVCVCALGVVPLLGCSDPTDDGGAAGTGGTGGAGGTGGTGGTSGTCLTGGVTCSCNVPSTGACNRVHLSNLNNQAGIMVVLNAGEQECTIDELIVNAPGGTELDQCVMDIGIGNEVKISPVVAAVVSPPVTCVVDGAAEVVEGEIQTFASIFGQPLSVACEVGFTMQSGP